MVDHADWLLFFCTSHSLAENCAFIRSGGKKGLKERKASPYPEEPAMKKNKPSAKVTKAHLKGPINYDRQFSVINDKNLPCSRSLTCKFHSMGAKRAVQGRPRNYDELLPEWQLANNPNFVQEESDCVCAVAVPLGDELRDELSGNLDDLDSEIEMFGIWPPFTHCVSSDLSRRFDPQCLN